MIMMRLVYTTCDIQQLLPIILHCVVSNQIQKPYTGVPKCWMILQQLPNNIVDNSHNLHELQPLDDDSHH